jgi:chromosome segregation ATPase
MTPQETIAHLQSQLDECRKELAEARSRAFNHEESYRRLIENTDAEALSYRSEITRLKELKHAAETALAALQSRVEAGERIRERDLESDSIVASCGCLTKTNEVKYHKPGCKYRLVSERDEARSLIRTLHADLVEVQRIAAFDLSNMATDKIFQYCKKPLAAIDAAASGQRGDA